MTCGIYALSFNEDNLIYIGKSKNIQKRCTEHLWVLNNQQGSKKLQIAFNTYGSPKLVVLLECKETELDNKELELISEFNSVNEGLNSLVCSNGCGNIVGEGTNNAKHSNEEYEHVFNVLVNCPNKSFADIERDTGVSIQIIASISAGTQHLWLKDKYPEKYLELEKQRGNRLSFRDSPKFSGKYTKEQLYNVLLLLIENKLSHKEISDRVQVSKTTVADISSLRRHIWLENAYPIEYQQLKQLKTKRK